ncbi:hypothetical protein EVC37_04220 [Methylocaldum sp. BRCS4]|uniref:hypothetical protein n=1 Tax=Methylocaldum sp. GT1BB TaxID=3438963 RepID=UPI00111C498A|nr:hypothetical protein [Methylocaldum sp. BRCS4]
MAKVDSIVGLLNPRKNRLLTVAQAALPPTQFAAFKQVLLDELGRNGFERDLRALLMRPEGADRFGSGRNT